MCCVFMYISRDIGNIINVDSELQHNVTQSYKEPYGGTDSTSGTTIQVQFQAASGRYCQWHSW